MRVFPQFAGPMYAWPRVATLPHAEEVLTGLHADWLLAVATNASDSEEGEIWMALERVRLNQLMDKVYCYRAIGHKKPHPAFFKHILRDLKLSRDSILMVGDDLEVDIIGAQNRASRRSG